MHKNIKIQERHDTIEGEEKWKNIKLDVEELPNSPLSSSSLLACSPTKDDLNFVTFCFYSGFFVPTGLLAPQVPSIASQEGPFSSGRLGASSVSFFSLVLLPFFFGEK